jgi:Mg-chelatase subunit ChlD
MPLGAETTITTALQSACQRPERPLHLVFVVDASEQMIDRRNWLPALTGAIENALRALPAQAWEGLRVGVISFRDRTAETEAYLTGDPEEVVSALHNIGVSLGSECIECGLREALRKARRALQAGRGDQPPLAYREVILLASRGFEPQECDAVRASTNEVKPFGILVATACGGGGCDRRCLHEAASSDRFAYAAGDWGYMPSVLDQAVGASGYFLPVDHVTLVDELAGELEYIGGGEPDVPEGSRLKWRFDPWPAGGVSITYRAVAAQPGRFKVSRYVTATVFYEEVLWRGITHTVSFSNPVLLVIRPTPTASPTPTALVSGTPTVGASATPSPGVSPTVPTPAGSGTPAEPPGSSTPTSRPSSPIETATPFTPSPSITAVATSRTSTLHLPIALASGCSTWSPAVDVAFLIDVSGSMAASDVGGMASRWDAAAHVAETLVAYHLHAPEDRAALIAFAGRAEVRSGLDAGLAGTRRELQRLPRWNGSRLDLGLRVALEELLDAHAQRPASRMVIVLLTDGDLNQTLVSALQDVASLVRRSGVEIVAIVLGDDPRADLAAMATVTGSPARVITSRGISLLDVVEAASWRVRCGR